MTEKKTPEFTPEFQQMVEQCAEIVTLDREIKKLQAKKKSLSPDLIKLLRKLSDGKFKLANGDEIVVATSTERTATKGAIVTEFGDEGATFWSKIKPKKRSYLTVIREDKITGEEES